MTEGRCTRKRDTEHKAPKVGSSLQGRGWDPVLLLLSKGVGSREGGGYKNVGAFSPVKGFRVPSSALGDDTQQS